MRYTERSREANGGLGMTDFRKGKRYRGGVGLGLALLVSGTFASAEEVYTATLTAARGLGRKTAELTVTITSRTSEEDAAKLQKILQEQGSDAAIEEIRQFDRGVAKITGGPSSPIRHVRAHPGQNGSRGLIITPGPPYFSP